MATQEARYDLTMSFAMKKAGTDTVKWELNNTYNAFDYGQLVTAQLVITDALAKALGALGIAEAEGLGFKVQEALSGLQNAVANTQSTLVAPPAQRR